ncbi:MAG: Phosphocholine transferase AnkX [Chlamydiae bacterium]|nr:Phosphocholine transferase AnkX [Chlamydiota bacterium]
MHDPLAVHALHKRREADLKERENAQKAADLRSFFDAAINGSEGTLRRFLSSKYVNVNASDTKYISRPTALYFAAQEGHAHIVERLLGLGAKINWGTDDYRTPLWIAARNGHQKALEILIKRGGSLDGCNDEGLTPLAAAAYYNHPDCLSLLMKSRAKVDLYDKAGNSALHHAIIKGHENVVRLLLVEGAASVTKGDKQGNEPLHLAVIHRQTQIIKLLVQLGNARVDSLNREGKSPIDLAIEKGDLDTLNVLLDLAPDIIKTKMVERKGSLAPLECASFHGHSRIIERLLKAGATENFSSFLIAATNGHIEVVRLLLKINPKMLNNLNLSGRRALCLAVEYNSIEVIVFLLEQGADPNGSGVPNFATTRSLRYAPLHLAKDPAVIDLLVAKGADVNQLNSEEETPLVRLAQNNFCQAIETLCKHGAIINFCQWPEGKKPFRQSPLEVAVLLLQFDAIRTLVKCGADVNARNQKNVPLLKSVIDGLGAKKEEVVRQKWFQVAKLLFQLGASPNDVDDFACPLIVRAALGRPIDVIEFLLKEGADIHKPSSEGFTALHVVSDVDLLDFLIANKAQVQAQDSTGESPLHKAAGFGRLACFKKLVERGADLQALDGEGLSPFYHACLEGQLQIVDFLTHHDKTLKEQIKLYQTKGKKEISYGTINDKVKKSAVTIILEHLEAYEKMSQSRWLVKPHSTREGVLKELKTKLEETKKDSKLGLTDVLRLVKGVQDFIKEKRAHGLKGYEKSKLYIELEKATRRIKQACDVISSIIEHNMH